MPKAKSTMYYTNTPLDEKVAVPLLQEVKDRTKENYIFGGPQGSTDDTKSSEFVISNNHLPDLKYMPSAHEVHNNSKSLMIHEKEVDTLKMVPDYYKNPTDQKFDNSRIRDFHSEYIDKFDDQMPRTHKKNKPLTKKEEILSRKLKERGINLSDKIIDTVESFNNDTQSESSLDLATRLINVYSNNE